MSASKQRPDQGMIEQVGGWVRTPRPSDAWKRWLKYGIRDEPTPGYTGLYEAPGDHIGICCSGGGIRSAAFNLGALQVLLRDEDVRRDAKYLSAVSGGSYIASAFCMIAKRWDSQPNDDDSDPELVNDDALPFHPGSPEEQYLRNHLGYLAPDGMAKVYLGLRMVAGLVVNVLLVGLPVLIVGIVVGLAVDSPYGRLGDGTMHVPRAIAILVIVPAAASLFLAMLDVLWRPKTDDRQKFARTWEVRLLLVAVLAAVVLIVVAWLAALAVRVSNNDSAGSGAFESLVAALSSTAALAAAAVTHVRGQVRDKQRAMAAAETRLGKYAKQVRNGLVAIVVILAGPLLLVAIAVFGVLITVNSPLAGAIVLGVSAVVLLAMWIGVDLTTVSLHPFYRRQLATAFALRRVWVDENGEVKPAPEPVERERLKRKRKGREVAVQRPFDTVVELSESSVEPGGALSSWPMLIVCAAANVSDAGATPPGRAVASFTFSPTAIGGPLTGATETIKYEKLASNRRRDVTLPAAVAMSGAALSPSMGKLTYRPLTFLLALANIRLGVWVPNPRHINETELKSLAPKGRHKRSVLHRPRPEYLWKELFGRNRLDDKFLYVTDGGHYENLGLVELLRRGCGTIYCFDAGGGSTSEALGDAIALARAELNVDIEMDSATKDLEESKEPPVRSKAVCAEGTITYPDGVKGRIFYVRSVVSEDSPWDLGNYQDADGVFPHHSTFDQFFNDQKFEAYRRLGTCAARAAIRPTSRPTTPDELLASGVPV